MLAKKTIRCITVILCLLLLTGAMSPATFAAVGYDDINDETSDAMKAQLDELEKQKQSLLNEIQSAEETKADAIYKQELYLSMQSLYEDELESLTLQQLLIENELEEMGREITALELEYKQTYDNMLSILRMTYEEGTANYIEIILGASDLSDLLSRIERVSGMINYNDRLMKKLTDAEKAVEKKYQEQQKKLAEHESAIADVEAKNDEIAKWNSENELTLLNIENSLSSLGEEYDYFADRTDILNQEFEKLIKERIAAEEARLAAIAEKLRQEKLAEAERKRLEAEKAYAAALAAAARAQGYMWPLPTNYTRLSSVYNEVRTINSLGYENKVHYGIDIPAPRGTNIYAAKSGTVIKSTYHSTYGNYIIIDHGDGSQTVYAHCSKLLVSAGKVVSQGDVIALVGTTGSSTGNHLHLELRLAGKTVDPMKYLVLS